MTKCEEVFKYELSLIKTEEIKIFVIKCFELLCPDYFWTVPTSTTGKYHPAISSGEGGLVRHVKYATWWAERLIRFYIKEKFADSPFDENTFNQLAIDCIFASVILHDLVKDGYKSIDERKKDNDIVCKHGIMLGQLIYEQIFNKNITKLWQLTIINSVANHMSKWTKGKLELDKRQLEKLSSKCFDDKEEAILFHCHYKVQEIVKLADYCAASKVEDIFERIKNDNRI